MTLTEATARPDAEPEPPQTPTWRTPLGITLAVAGIAVALAMPAPHRTTGAGGPAGVPSGPRTLASIWPSVKPFPIPAVLPGGLSYHPELILDSTTSVGVASTADQRQVTLAVVSASGKARILKRDDAGGTSFDNITSRGDQLLWIERLVDAAGQQRASLWLGNRRAGNPRVLNADIGEAQSNGSRYDLQIVGDSVVWVVDDPNGAASTQVRSVALAGGKVSTRSVAGAWQLAAWPTLVARASPGAPYQLFDLDTGKKRTVPAPADRVVECSPRWCRVSPGSAAQAQATTLMHLDGSAVHRVSKGEASAVSGEVALEDRFEPLLGVLTTTASSASALTLYDLKTSAKILIEPAATNARASGHYVWWSTGDNETDTWQGIDLRTLR